MTVFAGEAFDEGIDFYDRGSLFLADEIPGEFLEVGEIQDDGIERDDHRRGRGRRGGDGGRRGRGRRGGGRSARDRDDDRPRGGQPRREERPARDEAPSPEEPREPEVQETPALPGGAPSFGLGLDGSQGQPAAPEPEPEPEPIAAPEPVEEPESPKGAAEESGPPASGFGAGL